MTATQDAYNTLIGAIDTVEIMSNNAEDLATTMTGYDNDLKIAYQLYNSNWKPTTNEE